MTINDLNNLDFNDIATAPLPIRLGFIISLVLAVLFVGYWFVIKDQLQILDEAKLKEQELVQVFDRKQRRASRLSAYEIQLTEMRRSFGDLLKQLPSETEIPGLVVDISETGLSNGLEIDLFKPGREIQKEFYAEKPIDLVLRGRYEQLAQFASDIAGLPRIVTMHDIVLEKTKKKQDNTKAKVDSDRLTMKAKVKTYRYLDDAELEQ